MEWPVLHLLRHFGAIEVLVLGPRPNSAWGRLAVVVLVLRLYLILCFTFLLLYELHGTLELILIHNFVIN